MEPTHTLTPRHAWTLVERMIRSGVVLLPLAIVTLLVGMSLYHWVEGLGWPSAFLNAAMLLGGMGPVDPIHSTAGKWVIGLYALFAGAVFLILAGAMLGPVVHHVLERHHLADVDEPSPAPLPNDGRTR